MIEDFKRWWVQNVVADEPTPEYTYLDRLDGLQRGSNAEDGRNNHAAY